MIYIKDRLLFVHIPRTAGNSITRTLAAQAIESQDIVCVTDATPREHGLHRHSTFAEIAETIPEVASEQVFRFAIDRDEQEIFESFYRLHLSCSDDYGGERWQASVRAARQETLNEFIDRLWVPWLAGKSVWSHWTKGAEFHRVPYRESQSSSSDFSTFALARRYFS